eukprot:6014021-Lingulodinium_polyedra.AAC.1
MRMDSDDGETPGGHAGGPQRGPPQSARPHELSATVIAEITRIWGITYVVTGYPERLLHNPNWQATGATSAAAGGD